MPGSLPVVKLVSNHPSSAGAAGLAGDNGRRIPTYLLVPLLTLTLLAGGYWCWNQAVPSPRDVACNANAAAQCLPACLVRFGLALQSLTTAGSPLGNNPWGKPRRLVLSGAGSKRHSAFGRCRNARPNGYLGACLGSHLQRSVFGACRVNF